MHGVAWAASQSNSSYTTNCMGLQAEAQRLRGQCEGSDAAVRQAEHVLRASHKLQEALRAASSSTQARRGVGGPIVASDSKSIAPVFPLRRCFAIPHHLGPTGRDILSDQSWFGMTSRA